MVSVEPSLSLSFCSKNWMGVFSIPSLSHRWDAKKKISIHIPRKVIRKSQVMGITDAQICKEKCEPKVEFKEGRGDLNQKNCHGRSMDIFWNNTNYACLSDNTWIERETVRVHYFAQELNWHEYSLTPVQGSKTITYTKYNRLTFYKNPLGLIW